MRLLVLWSRSGLKMRSFARRQPAAPGEVFLAFDRMAHDDLCARGEHSIFADDLLTWANREEIESIVRNLVEELPPLSDSGCGNLFVAAAAELELRLEWTNVVRTYLAVRTLASEFRFEQVGALGTCPSSVMLATAAALGRESDPDAAARWVPVYEQPAASRAGRIANVVTPFGSHVRWREPRVLVVPGGKVLPALEATSSEVLRDTGVAVVQFPGLVDGGALRIGVQKRVPIVGSINRAGHLEDATVSFNLTVADPALARALRTTASSVIRGRRRHVLRAQRAADSLSRLKDVRGLLLPTTAVAEARVLRAWAAQRNVACAVLQHGIYSFRDWDRRDRDADTLLAWGEGVRDQFADDALSPEIRVVGAPGLSRRPRHRAQDRLEHLVFVTTNAPVGSGLGQYGFCEAFVQTVAQGAAHLLAMGIHLRCRIHPSESLARYRELFERLALDVDLVQGGPGEREFEWADAVVGAFSSFVAEAAGAGLPVAVWMPIPLDVRGRHLLPPLDSEADGIFDAQDAFTTMADQIAGDLAGWRAAVEPLRASLAALAAPFDAIGFEAELDRLSR